MAPSKSGTRTGQRIRLVVFLVTMSDGSEVTASLRIPWSGPTADHTCNAAECDFCIGQAERKAIRKAAKLGLTLTASVITMVRDGQSTSF